MASAGRAAKACSCRILRPSRFPATPIAGCRSSGSSVECVCARRRACWGWPWWWAWSRGWAPSSSTPPARACCTSPSTPAPAIGRWHPGGEPPLFAETARQFRPWLLLLIPALGGLLSGLLVFRLAPEAEGHGTDAAIAAFHHRQGHIRARVPLVKLVASAITIGTGGSGGREGSDRADRRRLRLASSAALFHLRAGGAPDPDGRRHGRRRGRHLPGAAGRGPVRRRDPLPLGRFRVRSDRPGGTGQHGRLLHLRTDRSAGRRCSRCRPSSCRRSASSIPWQLLAYLVLALVVVLLAMLYTRSFYGLSHVFQRLRLPRHFKPAIGGLATRPGRASGSSTRSAASQRVLAVLSSGYGALQERA